MKKRELTKREKETLTYIALGYTNQEIGEKLYITVHTVKQNISSAMNKLNAKNRTNLVVQAIKNKLIDFEV